MKRIVIRVQWSKKIGSWLVGGHATHQNKKESVAIGALACRNDLAAGRLAQLVVHNMNGRIAFERTYGRDPRSTKG